MLCILYVLPLSISLLAIPIETMMTCFRSTFFGWLVAWFGFVCVTQKNKLDPLILIFLKMKGNQVNTNRRFFGNISYIPIVVFVSMYFGELIFLCFSL